MIQLSARDAYRLWAPTYSNETAISHLEARLVESMTPPLRGLRLLDAGCGTGRRLSNCDAEMAVGVDICPEMLDAGKGKIDPLGSVQTMVADVQCLPLPDQAFDVVWCRLVLGHLRECKSAYTELARVARPGAILVLSDFHPAAYRAGHRRTFRAQDEIYEAEHHIHDIEAHLEAASSVGLELQELREAVIGPEVRTYYENAGRTDLYWQHKGLAVVLAIAFRKVA